MGYDRGEGVTVGVIDSGTQRDHPDLEVFAGYDLVEGDNDASPECIERPDGRGRWSDARHPASLSRESRHRGERDRGLAKQ